ncbi:sulfur carrier protein ThiS [Streptomyces sp. DSM 44915]|uniref:Sulfur carrier protein ThiS n=1 Tax=Streptomyces chisholmiae TaxID=3075540 RepID=A0ABU2JJ55_9ACTN|nr:sulfur carrier protein ThiS [Streptomyces sp. DSM 44915]MDT0264952.1 sulfur carrier protein ThiS [Streptomyces sp. DSM 44915]
MSAPVRVRVNGEPRLVPAGTSLAALVGELAGAPAGAAAPPGIAVARNEAVVPRGEWAGTTLAEGDRVEVLTAVQGG